MMSETKDLNSGQSQPPAPGGDAASPDSLRAVSPAGAGAVAPTGFASRSGSAPAAWRLLAEGIQAQERQRAAAVQRLRTTRVNPILSPASRAAVKPPGSVPLTSPSLPGRRGFTLLELLLAVAIFALVLLAIHYVFYGALKLRNKTSEMLEAAVPMQHTVALLRRDVLNLVAPGGTLSGQFQSLPTSTTNTLTSAQSPLGGRRVSPDLYTASANLDETSPWGEVQKVYYQLSPSTNDTPGLDLYRVVTRNLLPSFEEQPELQWLLGGVEDVLFEYYDGMQWRAFWDSTSEATPLPQAVKVQISLLPEVEGPARLLPVELVLPIVVQSRTNQTAQVEGGGA